MSIQIPTRKVPENIEQLHKYFRDARTDFQELNQAQRNDLYALVQMPGWKTLLDIMERACIQQETNLVNVGAAAEKKVLAEHKVAKAMWLFFLRIQRHVHHEICELFPELKESPMGIGEDLETGAVGFEE
jgi:uncharacterized protein (DUF2236 family)